METPWLTARSFLSEYGEALALAEKTRPSSGSVNGVDDLFAIGQPGLNIAGRNPAADAAASSRAQAASAIVLSLEE